MAVENTIAVWIDGINRTNETVLPLKYGNFLDERLDECNLSLRFTDEEIFSPLTPVEIQITNKFIFGKNVETYQEILYYVVANDNATEVILGKGLYNHELYLLEVTKVAECVIVDTLTFTNDLGKSYSDNKSYATPIWE